MIFFSIDFSIYKYFNVFFILQLLLYCFIYIYPQHHSVCNIYNWLPELYVCHILHTSNTFTGSPFLLHIAPIYLDQHRLVDYSFLELGECNPYLRTTIATLGEHCIYVYCAVYMYCDKKIHFTKQNIIHIQTNCQNS